MLRERDVAEQRNRVRVSARWLLVERSLLLQRAAQLHCRILRAVHVLSTSVDDLQQLHVSQHRRPLQERPLLLPAVQLSHVQRQWTVLQQGNFAVVDIGCLRRLYVACCNAARGAQSRAATRSMYRKFGEVWMRVLWDVLTFRHTDRHACHNTMHVRSPTGYAIIRKRIKHNNWL